MAGKSYAVRREDGKWLFIPISATLGPSWVEQPRHISPSKRSAEQLARQFSAQPPLYLRAEAVSIEADAGHDGGCAERWRVQKACRHGHRNQDGVA